jgi:hypothetical protein
MNQPSHVGMLNLTMCGGHSSEQIRLAAEQIRLLPGVLRVRLEAETPRLEIVFEGPATNLLAKVHNALKTAAESATTAPALVTV